MEEKDRKVETKDPDLMNSRNKMKTDDKDKETDAEEVHKVEEENFSYLEQRDNEDPSVFYYKIDKNKEENDAENIFKPNAFISQFVICILLKEDSTEDSELLKHTIKGIISNFGDLGELGINFENTLIYIFVNNIKRNELVSQEEIKNKLKEENKIKYLLTHLKYKGDERNIKIEVVSKRNYMSEIESLKCFYCLIVKSLKTDEKILITSVLTAGVIPNPNAFSDLIKSCLIDNNKQKKIYDCVSVPVLEINDTIKNESIFAKIMKYERVHFNIYNMNYYYSTGSVPILSLMNVMSIDKGLMNFLVQFYSLMDIMEENEMPKIDYHDYNLGLYLYTNNIPIKYLSKQSFGTIQYRDFDYQNIWVSKYSGYYSNFFAILKTLINFDLPIFHKIFILFQLIGILIEFIYPGLSILVIYSIFVEAFDIQDTYPAWFMTMIYIIMYLGSGVSSLISEKPRDTSYTNLIYYYFMEVYYLFILVCSIPAMDNIKKKKLFGEKYDDVEDFYKFNTAAITCLIIFTFLLSILPMIFRISMITDNIVSMLLYLVLGAPMSTSNLLIAKIWNAPGAPGGKSIDDRKGITILFFFLFNLFFGFLSAYIYDRKLRANCVMGLAIFYLIYLFFKIFGIIISLMGSPDLTQKKTNKAKSILEGKNTFDSKNSSDHINEEKLDNDNDNENGNNEENKEEHSKENDQNENQNEDNNEEKNEDEF